jgi:DNA modification methylase
MLVDGHLRAETTPEQEVPVLVLDIDEAEADKLLLSLDPLAALAETNAVALDQLLREVDTGSEGLQEMYADLAEAADLYKDDAKEIVEDEVPEPPVDPITKPGDLWILGEHRLLCGDSTKAEDVERLMAGAKAGMMVTDPPYGVEYDPSWRAEVNHDGPDSKRALGTVANDHRADWTDAWQLFDGDVAYVWHADRYSPVVAGSLEATGLEVRYLIVWAKQRHTFGRGHYHHQHEPCWCVVRKGATASWVGDRTQTTLWQIDNNRHNDTGHGTQKPVECMARPMRNHQAMVIYDPFCGSGTTLIAAEQLGRKCYGMEISPQYCDVIVKRWETLTGKKAELEKPNGKTRATARADDTEDSQRQPRKAAAKQARAKARK